MSRRKVLTALLIAFISVGVVMAALPLIGSLSPTDEVSTNGRSMVFHMSAIPEGSFVEFHWHGSPLVVFRPDRSMIRQLTALNGDVKGEALSPETAPQLFVYVPVSTYLGCLLVHYPKGGGPYGADWPGGWMDPCHYGAWDNAGRTLRAFNSISDRHLDPLESFDYRIVKDGVVEIYKNEI